MKCASCDSVFNDGVQCGHCQKQFGFCCAAITENGYRKLGPERRRAAWKCFQCRGAGKTTPAVSPTTLRVDLDFPVSGAAVRTADDQVTLSAVLSEIRSMRQQLTEDMRSTKQDVSDLRTSCDFNNSMLNEHSTRLSSSFQQEEKCREFQCLKTSLDYAFGEISTLKTALAIKDQRDKVNNVEVKGVPFKKSVNLFNILENLSKALDFNFSPSQVNYIARVPTHNPKEKSIIVSFHNRYTKENFVAAARARKSLSTADIPGFANCAREFTLMTT